MDPRVPSDTESAKVARQGAWVLLGEIANSALGFAFWAIAAHLFSPDNVGIAGSLVGLSSLATSIAILGLDNGFVRFATKVHHPRRLIRQIVAITGGLGVLVGSVLALFVITLGNVPSNEFAFLVGISILLTVSQIWFQVTDAAILAAGKSHVLALRAVAYGAIKIVLVFAVVAAGAAGLFAAYAIPLLLIVIVSFVLLPRFWPRENPAGTPHALREIASLSGGNWISGFAYSLPSRVGPSLIWIFFSPATVASFFIALQLAEVLNYVSEAVAKSLFAHGSREDRLDRSLASNMRALLVLILIPLVAVGLVAAPFALSVVGGETYSVHALSLQLFILATLPKSFYQILKAQFNVDRRPMALIVSGGSFGVFTLAILAIGLVLRLSPDLLPASWILGGIAGLGIAQYIAGWRPRVRPASVDAK